MTKPLMKIFLALSFCFATVAAWAGGPLGVGGPQLGTAGKPLTWPVGRPIQFRVDGGPLAKNPSGVVVIDNAAGIARVQSMFNNWQAVPTANISYQNAGPILTTGVFTGTDVQTVQDFNAVDGDCQKGRQSPIIFDADGTLFDQLIGDPNVIGFATICDVDRVTGNILSGEGVLNGRFQDGVSDGVTSNFELTTDEFNQAFTHEFGHFSGLDHSQINVDVLNGPFPCNADETAGLPLMFPILQCQARVTAGLPALAPDDAAWISFLYPVTAPAPAGKTLFSSAYGIIHGNVLLPDGVTGIQGVNVIARQVDNPATPQNESLTVAFSAVSGFRFTGNVGQSVSCLTPANPTPSCNIGGDSTGSRDTTLVGTFDIPVLVGTYSLSAESVDSGFTAGSSVGPLAFPIPMPGTAPAPATITVIPGGTVNSDIKLQGTPPRFDSFETSQLFTPAVFADLTSQGGQA
jgi:hypothetical protein